MILDAQISAIVALLLEAVFARHALTESWVLGLSASIDLIFSDCELHIVFFTAI